MQSYNHKSNITQRGNNNSTRKITEKSGGGK